MTTVSRRRKGRSYSTPQISLAFNTSDKKEDEDKVYNDINSKTLTRELERISPNLKNTAGLGKTNQWSYLHYICIILGWSWIKENFPNRFGNCPILQKTYFFFENYGFWRKTFFFVSEKTPK